MEKKFELNTEQEQKQEKQINQPEQEFINSLTLFDLYEQARNAGTYQQSLEEIKEDAEKIKLKLSELGATDLSSKSELNQAYHLTTKIIEHYLDTDLAQLTMKRIASLICESDGFKKVTERRKEEKDLNKE